MGMFSRQAALKLQEITETLLVKPQPLTDETWVILLEQINIMVLTPPGEDELARRQREYLNRYYASMELKVYWGTAAEFTVKLRKRWKKFKNG